MLKVQNLHKIYVADIGEVQAVRGISFEVVKGNFYTLLGPSGCGKTTTLQCIAGLETPDAGEIVIGGEVVFSSDRHINIPAHRRDLGVVFQSYAIWPHMTVFENVAFPLVHGKRRPAKSEVRERVMRALELVKLGGLEHRPVPFLSGGQQQRVALARSLVHEPSLLLLDEPMSNLDARLREEMRVELRQLVKSLNITTIYVTHDQVEALSMSDRIALMHKGLIIQEGGPKDIYMKPQTSFTADFIGRSNIFPGHIVSFSQGDRRGIVETGLGRFDCYLPESYKEGEHVSIMIRPEAVRGHAREADPATQANTFLGRILHVSFVGECIETLVQVGDSTVRTKLDPYLDLRIDAPIYLEMPIERCTVIRTEESA